MKKINFYFALLIIANFNFVGFAQIKATDSGGQVQTVQPKIMVIPYVKEGEDLRTILEEDFNKRVTLTKIKEAFDSRGFTTVDFIAKLKIAKDNKIFTSDNQTDIKDQIVQMSGADIYVQAEINIINSTSGNSVNLILTAYEVSTGNSLSNKVGSSGKFYTDDISKLASKSVESVAEEFLNVMQTKFTEVVNNGKSINIEISFSSNSNITMNSELGSDSSLLSDLLETWMEENSYKNNYHIQGITDLKIIFDDVRIPLKDQSNGRNYNSSKFSLEIVKYLKTLGLNAVRQDKGNNIYITIKWKD